MYVSSSVHIKPNFFTSFPVSKSLSKSTGAYCSSGYSSLSFSSTFRSLRWRYGVDWKSPISLTSQIRTAAVTPVLNNFRRKLTTMGNSVISLSLSLFFIGFVKPKKKKLSLGLL